MSKRRARGSLSPKATDTPKRPQASSPAARRRMLATRRRDTAEELQLRSALHSMGYRYRVDARIPNTRRRPDVVFRQDKVAVFVDGCFWHGCPTHGTWPKANAAWWRTKIEGNRTRDRDTSNMLRACGWAVLRFWSHADMASAAMRVATTVDRRRIARLRSRQR
jgi:DNA mismatch endonuclease (patch repair protein)